MKVLYVGHYLTVCTTRMRGEYLKDLLHPDEFRVVNIDIPMAETTPVFRSLGWRLKSGPLIWKINNYLRKEINNADGFNLVWIDKGVFIRPEILRKLKSESDTMVHFTPDTAFTHNQSELFYKALPLYDYCITTKSFEREFYEAKKVKHLLYCTQGYDPRLHKIYNSFDEKQGIVFIGQYEDSRGEVIAKLIENNFQVKLAGADWGSFAHRFRNKNYLNYLGSGLFGEAYARSVSGSLMGLGLLSKKFPEKHTTRTFEIPACGTVLATERNDEIKSFLTEKDALFFSDIPELIEKMRSLMDSRELLKCMTESGQRKITEGGYDYPSILAGLLDQMGLKK
jgi:spore maturation protein CgeB